ncbi:MAG: hypothetical protein GY771_08540 [bacterium]|nr:hypothetical protein [bacterium]
MDGAATITGIAYDIESVLGSDDGEFASFEMRLCHTSLSELTDNFDANYDGNTALIVATANPLVIPNDSDFWYSIPNMSSFSYNGTDNLIIETKWASSNGISFDCYCSFDTVMRNLQIADYDGTTGDLSNHIIRKKLTVQ